MRWLIIQTCFTSHLLFSFSPPSRLCFMVQWNSFSITAAVQLHIKPPGFFFFCMSIKFSQNVMRKNSKRTHNVNIRDWKLETRLCIPQQAFAWILCHFETEPEEVCGEKWSERAKRNSHVQSYQITPHWDDLEWDMVTFKAGKLIWLFSAAGSSKRSQGGSSLNLWFRQ